MRSAVFACFCLMALVASGGLSRGAVVIRITNDPSVGAGQTLWEFSGSSTYVRGTADGLISGAADLGLIKEWKGASGTTSDYVSNFYNNYTTALVSGSVLVSVAKSPSNVIVDNIDGIHVDHDDSGDDFGISLALADITLNDGDVVSWSGSAVFNVDFTKLNQGTYTLNNYDNTGTLALTIKVENVPEPATAVVGLSLMGSAWVVRRVRKRTR